jgi:hypothetical protein
MLCSNPRGGFSCRTAESQRPRYESARKGRPLTLAFPTLGRVDPAMSLMASSQGSR